MIFIVFFVVLLISVSAHTDKVIDANNGVNKVSSDIKKAVAPYLGICPDCIR